MFISIFRRSPFRKISIQSEKTMRTALFFPFLVTVYFSYFPGHARSENQYTEINIAYRIVYFTICYSLFFGREDKYDSW